MKGLFIGRFQPMHLGHASVIEKAFAELDSLIIGVGSSEKHHAAENPFTYEERKTMIESSVSGNYKIVPIPDINDYSKWVSHVETLAGNFDVVYSGNAIVSDLFTKKGYAIKKITEEMYISSSIIRDMMARGADWKKFTPKGVSEFIEKIDGVERVRKLTKNYLNPVPAVDIIIKYNRGIVLIKKKDGRIALPGGFEEFGESVENAVVREAKEETSLDVKLERLLGVYSDPKRDSRTHVISITYITEGHGELKGGDDAKEAFVVPLEDALKMKLGYDHNKILNEYKDFLDLREKIAELEHEQWVYWSKIKGETEKKDLWVPYNQLPEYKKGEDRVWADKVLNLFKV